MKTRERHQLVASKGNVRYRRVRETHGFLSLGKHLVVASAVSDFDFGGPIDLWRFDISPP